MNPMLCERIQKILQTIEQSGFKSKGGFWVNSSPNGNMLVFKTITECGCLINFASFNGDETWKIETAPKFSATGDSIESALAKYKEDKSLAFVDEVESFNKQMAWVPLNAVDIPKHIVDDYDFDEHPFC